jgi:hypothetical protein
VATEMEARRRRVSAVDGISAAAALTVLVGFFGIVNGFSGTIKATYIVNSLHVGDPVAWGVVMIVVGVLQLLVAYPMGQPRRWALAGGAALAVANAVLVIDLLGDSSYWAILLLIGDAVILGLVALFARETIEELAASEQEQAEGGPGAAGRSGRRRVAAAR